MTIIYVDADACPVKDEIITVAIRHGCRAVMVCNGGIRPNPHPLILSERFSLPLLILNKYCVFVVSVTTIFGNTACCSSL